MPIPMIETGYKPEFALGALYQGMNAANADEMAQQEIIDRVLSNFKRQQDAPLDYTIKQAEAVDAQTRMLPTYQDAKLRGYIGQNDSQEASGRVAQALAPFRISAEKAKSRLAEANDTKDFNLASFQKLLTEGVDSDGNPLDPEVKKQLFNKYIDAATIAYQTPEFLGKKQLRDDEWDAKLKIAQENATKAAHSPFLDMHKTYSKGVSDLETKIQKLEKEITDDQMMKPIYDKLNKGISIDNENPNAVNKIRSLQFLRNELMNRKATVNYLAEHLGLPSEVVNSNNESSTYTTPDGRTVTKLRN
jgi:hypothetical protein